MVDDDEPPTAQQEVLGGDVARFATAMCDGEPGCDFKPSRPRRCAFARRRMDDVVLLLLSTKGSVHAVKGLNHLGGSPRWLVTGGRAMAIDPKLSRKAQAIHNAHSRRRSATPYGTTCSRVARCTDRA